MSIVYCVTVKPDTDIHDQYLYWLQSEHIAEVVGTGCFDHSAIFKVLSEDESDGISYSIQYTTTTMERYLDYIHDYAPIMRAKGKERFGDKFVAFRTLLRKV